MEWRFVIYWIVLACAEGVVQGHYYDLVYRYGQPKRWNLHAVYNVVRICVLAYIWAALPYDPGADKWTHWQCFIFCFFLCWMHPFFHNGVLYTMRNYFSPEIYKKKFWANKEFDHREDQKASIMEWEVWLRVTGFIFSIAALILLIHFE